MEHVILTTHIQQLLRDALDLATAVHRTVQGDQIDVDGMSYKPTAAEALARISNLAIHAAAEIEDERQRCYGWH